jgi:hypothetical protein
MTCTDKKGNVYKESEGNSPLGRHRHTWEDNTEVNLQETELKGMD